MKTLLFASALLLSAAGADGSPGGIPDGSDPNLNDATHAPPKPELTEAEIATLGAGGIDATEAASIVQGLAAGAAPVDPLADNSGGLSPPTGP